MKNQIVVRETVKAEILEIIAEELDMRAEDNHGEMLIINDLGADSLDAITFTLAIEEKYEFHIEDEALQNFRIIDDIVNEVMRSLENE